MAEYDDEYWEDDELPVPQALVAGGADSIPVDPSALFSFPLSESRAGLLIR